MLLGHFEDLDESKVINAARELISSGEKNVQTKLLEILYKTNSRGIRNALALLLTDIKNEDAFDVIVALLTDNRTINNRGTLLYALYNYNCSTLLPLLIDFVINGNFEESNGALNLITGIETWVSEDDWNQNKIKISEALKVANEERKPLLLELWALFDSD